MTPKTADFHRAYRLRRDIEITLDSYRLNRFLNDGSVAHLALGRVAERIQDCRDRVWAEKNAGRTDWFERGGGAKYFEQDGDALRIRESIYFDPPVKLFDKDLRLRFRARRFGKDFSIPLDEAAYRALSAVLWRMKPWRKKEQVAGAIGIEGVALINFLMEHGIAEETSWSRNSRPRKYGVTLAGHACLVFESPRARLVTDPLLTLRARPALNRMPVVEERTDAILISHPHWDHFNLDTLLLVDRDTIMYVPKPLGRRSVVNYPMAVLLRRMGFENIREIEPWREETIGDITFTALPFYGESSGEEGRQDWMTYHVRLGGRSALGFVDAANDSHGSMDEVAGEVRSRFGPVDFFFAPCAGFRFQKSQYLRRPCYLTKEMEPFTGSPEDALRWADAAGARHIIPYAGFEFTSRDIFEKSARLPQFATWKDLSKLAENSRRNNVTLLKPGEGFWWTKGKEPEKRPTVRPWAFEAFRKEDEAV